MIESIENTVSHLPQHMVYGDGVTLIGEVSAALVPGPGWEESAVMREDLGGDHLKLLEDPDHDMENFLIEIFAEARPEIGEGGLTRQIFQAKAGISAIGPAPVPEQSKDVAAVEVPMKSTKQIDQEEAGRIIAGWSDLGVAVGNQAANEGEIDQRGDHFGIATLDGAIREDLHESFFELVV